MDNVALDSRRWAPHRVLRLFTDVRPGEAAFSLLLATSIFLLLTAYYVLKTVREPLILLSGVRGLSGQELKVYAAAAQAVFFLFAVPAYGKLASRMDRVQLFNTVVIFFIVSLLALNLLGHAEVPVGIAFYTWLGVIGVMLVAQFWSFANDLCTPEQGLRLFPLIAVGGSLGSIAGSALARFLIVPLGVFGLMLVAALLLALDLLTVNLVHDLETKRASERDPAVVTNASADGDAPREPPPTVAPRATARRRGRAQGGFRLVMRTHYLLLIAGMLLIGNVVNTQGEYILADAVNAHAHARVPDDAHPELSGAERSHAIKSDRQTDIARFYGAFYATVNLASFLLQAFFVSRIMAFLGVRGTLFLLPMVAFGGYALIALSPTLLIVGLVKLGENGTDYSVHNTVRQALFLPTSRDVKYQAKAALDTFFVRVGDLAAGLAIYLGLHWLGLSRAGFAAVNAALALVWVATVLALGAEHRRLNAQEKEQPELASLPARPA